MARTPKTYKIEYTRYSHYHGYTTKELEMTLDEFNDYFRYTLECGHSYNAKIPTRPKTIKSFINALNKSFIEKRTYHTVSLIG